MSGNYEKTDNRNIPWELLSDEEKNKIKRKSMEKKAEVLMKEIKIRDEKNSGRQRTQSNAWDVESDKINDVSSQNNVVQKVKDTNIDRIARKKRIRSGKADAADYWE